jgi:hypothetical protein
VSNNDTAERALSLGVTAEEDRIDAGLKAKNVVGVDKPYDVCLANPIDPRYFCYAVHGDPWEMPDGRLAYYCRICDWFAHSIHFRRHARDQHIRRYSMSLKAIANIACSRWVSRPHIDAADLNLIARALDREQQRENDAQMKQISEGCPLDHVKTRPDSGWCALNEILNRGG